MIETPTPTLKPEATLAEIFDASSVNISFEGTNKISQFRSEFNALSVESGGFNRIVAGRSAEEVTFSGFMGKLLISVPEGLTSVLNDSNSIIMAYGQRESFDAQGQMTTDNTRSNKVALVVETNSSSSAMQFMQDWESNLVGVLAGSFGLNEAKMASIEFLDNTYGSVAIRYKNFTYPDSSIDYAVIQAGDKSYLVIAGSRELMFEAIDILQRSSETEI